MRKCKITVIKTMFNEDLAEKYAVPDHGPCPFHKVGDTYYADWEKPAGMCDQAWITMQNYVMALAHDAKNFYDGNWLKENIAITCCNDGTRPVVFKIEPMED